MNETAPVRGREQYESAWKVLQFKTMDAAVHDTTWESICGDIEWLTVSRVIGSDVELEWWKKKQKL